MSFKDSLFCDRAVVGGWRRPEGDVILPGAPSSLEFVAYGVLLGGALSGTVTVVWLTPRPVRPTLR